MHCPGNKLVRGGHELADSPTLLPPLQVQGLRGSHEFFTRLKRSNGTPQHTSNYTARVLVPLIQKFPATPSPAPPPPRASTDLHKWYRPRGESSFAVGCNDRSVELSRLRMCVALPSLLYTSFDSRQGREIFLFSITSRQALGSTESPIQWVPGLFPRG
jgi:hypothetical protein